MPSYRKANPDDLSIIASLIERFNQHPQSHIGFCGSNHIEIKNALSEDLSDVPFADSFILTFNEDKLVGLIGFDFDVSRAVAEIWGPFVEEKFFYTLDEAWQRLLKLMPNCTKGMHFFPNSKYELALDWLKKINANFVSEEITLSIEKEAVDRLETSEVLDLSPDFEIPMTHLHDLSFPKTYYSGQDILKRMNQHQKVFIHTIEQNLSGYIYVEANPETHEGSIEFFAVDPKYRGHGIGKNLIAHALKFIFSFDGIKDVQLCVTASNPVALHLYEKVGFKKKHTLCYYTKTLI